VNAAKELDGSVSGTSKVVYSGTPSVLKVSKSGASKVEKK
jgi:hypothetical protein